MVRSYPPQLFISNKIDYSPQGIKAGGISPPGTLLLDLFPGAEAAYSLRQLRTAYLGPAIQVERTSDNATQDIGFLANGDLDVTSLLSFIGGSDGLIKILYDQSGNNMNMDDDLGIARRPKIVDAGTLQVSNGLPAITFDDVDDIIQGSNNPLTSPAPNLFVFGVWEKTDLADRPANFNLNTPEDVIRVSVHAPFDNGVIFWDPGNSTTERLQTTADFNDLIQHLYTFTKTAGTDKQIIKRDGTKLAEKTQATTSTVVDTISIGNFNITNASFSAMKWQELIFYDIDKFNDIEQIESNVAASWKPAILSETILTEKGESLITNAGELILY